jgi:hypothetical protein
MSPVCTKAAESNQPVCNSSTDPPFPISVALFSIQLLFYPGDDKQVSWLHLIPEDGNLHTNLLLKYRYRIIFVPCIIKEKLTNLRECHMD